MKNLQILSIIYLLSGLLILQNCQTKEKKWVLKGSTSKQVNMVYLYGMNTFLQKNLLDSAKVETGKFTIEHTNQDDQLTAFTIDFDKDGTGGVQFFVSNGDHLKVVVKDEYNSVFSGTPASGDYNKYNSYRYTAMNRLDELSNLIANTKMNEDELNDKMLIFKEKMQDLENEKISFLRSIQYPQLNSFLVLNEIISTGIIEKELFDKYVKALTPEGAMTNNGHLIHQIYQVIDAWALSRELNILDTATIRKRYNNLDEENKNSEFAKEVKEYLEE